jgi:hypothetical protein
MSSLEGVKKEIETSAVFKDWRNKNPKGFFYLAFTMFEKISLMSFELAYYSPKTKLATIFVAEGGVSIKEEDKVFADDIPKPLNIDDAKIGIGDAVAFATDVQVKSYPSEAPSKTIAMLQVLNGKVLWNITFFTIAFSTLNIKVDAKSGKIMKHSLAKLFDFAK